MEEEKVSPKYFVSICDQITTIESLAPWADQVWDTLQLLEMDLRFLEAFCLCLETWDYSTEKEESMKRLTSIVTPLRVVWPNEHKSLSILKRLAEEWDSPETMSIEDFHSAVSELEAKILQSKQLIEPWCENLMHSSMQFKFSTYSSYTIIWNLLEHLLTDMRSFSTYRVDGIIPLEEQLDILRQKIVYLKTKLEEVEDLLSTTEIRQFLSFSCVFANKALCLTCLYWAKESNQDIATEMNIVLFNMLQRHIPCAPDITPLFVGILKSYGLKVSDSLLLGEAIEVVEFFFDHLTTVLKDDDFHIVRAQLVFLFTFLVNPLCENAEQDSIRSQVYALFREDAYLHLPFDQMKDDFNNKKMLLGDCMIKIDLAKSRIKQLDNEFSDSWIRVEVDNLVFTQFSSHLTVLLEAVEYIPWDGSVEGQLQSYTMDLRHLKMSLLCFAAWDATEEEISVRLKSMITNLQGIWEKGHLVRRLEDITFEGITDWYPLAQELEEKIRLSKREIHVWLVNLFNQPLRCKPPTSYTILKLLESILDSLQDLVEFKLGEIVPYVKQIETLKDSLVFLKNLVRLSANCLYSKVSGEFKLLVQVFANGAAFLISQYWKAEPNDENAYETNTPDVARLYCGIKPDTPDVARLYFGILEAIYVQRSDSRMFGETVSKFADLFLEDSVTPTPWKYEFQILRDDIILLLTFLNDPPSENTKEVIGSRIDALFWEDAYGFLPFDNDGGDIINKKVCLDDFMMKIGTINAVIIKTYGNYPNSSRYNFPKFISPLFLDSLIQSLQNLKERLISDLNYAPFARYKILIIEEELGNLRPLFNSFFNLQSDLLDQTWYEVIDSLHQTDHVIRLCISSCFVFDHPIWYHMAHLSIVFDELKGVKTKLEKIKETTMQHDARRLPRSADLISTHSEQAKPSSMNEIVVGFDGEADTITENITRGSMSLDTVSIVGMGGLGKTTLAKKVYNSLKGNGSFVVFSFCYVSQDPNSRQILLDILGDVVGIDSTFDKMTDDDLAHRLSQGLSGRTYLIVLDDIWSESAWYKVRGAFPDHKNGSRVVFTTRSREVADNCKISRSSVSPHQLRLLSEDESWELLQKKVFSDGKSPTDLLEIGKLIAKNCKGLPLAIGVVSGLLFRREKDLGWWSEVAERVVSYVSEKGCSQILELSYKHMPVNLKPCFVYLGAFPEDMVIKVKNVILLWIAEGFIQESKTKNLEDVGKEYIRNLVDRSLIIVDATSSTGDTKQFRVHDLMRDICQTKCRDGIFLQINHGIGIASSNFSNPSANPYRISTVKKSDYTFATAGSSLSNARSLLCFNKESGDRELELPLSQLILAQVLDLESTWIVGDIKQLSSLVHLRHINARLKTNPRNFFSSISNLWNISSITMLAQIEKIVLPDTFWTVNSLRHVKLDNCFLSFSDRSEQASFPKLDKVVSFGIPCLSTGRDVQRLLQRLPAVQRLSCSFEDFDESVETFDYPGKLESLSFNFRAWNIQCLINFPSTLKKLTLESCQLPSTAILAIAKLEFLQVLKLRFISFPEERLETEDLVFQKLIFFELYNVELVEWNASDDTFPCIEQLVIIKTKLNEIPSCFGEIATLKRIDASSSSPGVRDSARKIQEEQRGDGNKVEVLLF